jgi:tRNA-specific 2-thiouridylase
MSQRRDSLRVIERESGLEGLLLRPLSAQHFEPTIPEREGWVDRDRLLAIKGRSRKELFELADEIDVKNYPCPAGGCLLTELSFVPKVQDIFDHSDELNLRDFRMLKIGRHFRIGERTKLIIGRDESDNRLLEAAMQPGETSIFWMDGNTPAGVIVDRQDEAGLDLAMRILLRYTRAEPDVPCRIQVVVNGEESIRQVVNTITETEIAQYRIDLK